MLGSACALRLKGEKVDRERVANVVKQMSLDEKIALTSVGADLRTAAIPRLKVPSLKLPREFSWCAPKAYPSFAALGHTFDTELIKDFARLRSREAYVDGESFGGAVSLGVTRKPFIRSASRAFSEEPLFVGAMARAYCTGSSLKCIGTDLTGVTRHNRYIGERALGEIYLRPFHDVADLLGGISVCGCLGGVPASECRPLMKTLTKFDGLIFTPAGAVSDKAEQVSSGACLDVLDEKGDRERLKKAVENGLLYERKLNKCAERTVLAAAECYNAYKTLRVPAVTTSEKQALYRRLFEESATLLKNDGVLPLSRESRTAIVRANRKTVAKATKRAEKVCRGFDVALIWLDGADEIPPAEISVLIGEVARYAAPVLVASAPCYFPLPYLSSVRAFVYLPFTLEENTYEALEPLLYGDTDFTGKLAFSWASGALAYPYAALGFTREGYCGESVYVGNRYFSRVPGGLLFGLGHGLSYGSAKLCGMRAVVSGGEIEAEFDVEGEGEFETVAFLEARLGKENVFGVSGAHIAFSRISVGKDKKTFRMSAPAPEVYDPEKKKFVRLKGKYELRLKVAGEEKTAVVTVEGEDVESLSKKRLPSYYVKDGVLNIDAREAEMLTGALPIGADALASAGEVARAEKVLVGEMKRLKRADDREYVLSHLPDTAKIKTARALKER